jgi:hypothetical protein
MLQNFIAMKFKATMRKMRRKMKGHKFKEFF